jgi:hypothetical protein
MRVGGALAGLGLAALLASCELVTGGTSGYEPQPAAPACSSSADCGDAGQVCCDALGINGSGNVTTGPACRQTCALYPGLSFPQLCAQSSECLNDAACTRQACSGDAGDASIQACGLLLGCHAL